MSLYLGNNLISGIATPVEPTRNIGQIIQSTLPLTDAGLHLLDGALISGSGSYSAFVDYIADLYTANPMANYFTDETTWQNTVTQYGVCGKFVYDSTNNTVRLPKVTGIIEGTIDISALGDLVEAGLPLNWLEHKHTRGDMNITGSGQAVAWNSISYSGAFTSSKGGVTASVGTSSSNNYFNFNFAASRSWTGSTSTPNYTNSSHDASTVQPQTIKCFVYIVIATSTKTDIQVDIDEIATDLNGKADVDLSNTTDQAKILMASMGMPSNKYIDLTLGASGTQYTAPADGYFYIRKFANNPNEFVWMQNASAGNLAGAINAATYAGMYLSAYIPIGKSNVMGLEYSATGSTQFFRFIYAVGSESEGA